MIILSSKIIFCGILFGLVEYCLPALFFPTNTAYGIFGAISVPLDLPNSVFISYNFEANYILPSIWELPLILKGREMYEHYSTRKIDSFNITEEFTPKKISKDPKKQYSKKSLLSRMDFYRILNDQFFRSGMSGEACLLRLICEFNSKSAELANVNGVLGSIMYVIFSPSSSGRESNLPMPYINAEINGKLNQCFHYKENCTESILNLFSSKVEDIFYDLMLNIK